MYGLATVARAAFISLQGTAFGKTTKLIDQELGAKGQFSLLVNKATFGTIFFAMLISLVIVQYGSLATVIAFDAVTFALNGLIVFFCLKGPTRSVDLSGHQTNKQRVAPSPGANLVYYARTFPSIYRLDFVLALIMCGANTLNARVYSLHPEYIPLASGAFGLAVWLAGPLDRWRKLPEFMLWLVLAGTLFAQGLLSDYPQILLALSFFRNLAYWVIYNRITIQLTRYAKADEFAQLTASRMSMTILVGALGEWWVGATARFYIYLEMAWRSVVATVAMMKSIKQNKLMSLTFVVMLAQQGL